MGAQNVPWVLLPRLLTLIRPKSWKRHTSAARTDRHFCRNNPLAPLKGTTVGTKAVQQQVQGLSQWLAAALTLGREDQQVGLSPPALPLSPGSDPEFTLSHCAGKADTAVEHELPTKKNQSVF